jgi:hypothetical protein
MERIFNVIDEDGGGDITFSEMQRFISEDNSELSDYLEALGITSSDVWVLFKLLDLDGSGKIDVHEFIQGCMRLKGEARSFDINCMMYENRAMMKHSADFMEYVESQLSGLESLNAQWLLEIDERFAIRLAALSKTLTAPTAPRKSLDTLGCETGAQYGAAPEPKVDASGQWLAALSKAPTAPPKWLHTLGCEIGEELPGAQYGAPTEQKVDASAAVVTPVSSKPGLRRI